MIRRIVIGLLGVAFLVAGLGVAQEPAGDDPPVRLKKKVRPEAADKAKEEQPKPPEPPKEEPKEKPDKEKGAKEGEEPAQPDEPEMDQAEVLNRVGKNMRTSEDRLANRELNDGTRQVQEDILKDLDSLINQAKNGGGDDAQNQNQQQQNGEQQQNGQQKQGGQTKMGMARKKGGLKGQQQARAGQKPGGQKPGGQQGQQQQANAGQKPGGQQGQKPSQQQAGNQGGGGGQSQGEATKLAEMYKDVWGHLPETMRAEMNAYSREQFMAKYNDLIKQYYSTVAEKSRKKD